MIISCRQQFVDEQQIAFDVEIRVVIKVEFEVVFEVVCNQVIEFDIHHLHVGVYYRSMRRFSFFYEPIL